MEWQIATFELSYPDPTNYPIIQAFCCDPFSNLQIFRLGYSIDQNVQSFVSYINDLIAQAVYFMTWLNPKTEGQSAAACYI